MKFVARWAPLVAVGCLAVWVFQSMAFSADESKSTVEEKLDRVLENQERILASLDEVKEGLRVIKVRASM